MIRPWPFAQTSILYTCPAPTMIAMKLNPHPQKSAQSVPIRGPFTNPKLQKMLAPSSPIPKTKMTADSRRSNRSSQIAQRPSAKIRPIRANPRPIHKRQTSKNAGSLQPNPQNKNGHGFTPIQQIIADCPTPIHKYPSNPCKSAAYSHTQTR